MSSEDDALTRKKILGSQYWGSYIPVAIVVVKGQVDWAAYIGAGCRIGERKDATLLHVARYGCKLDEAHARFLFPDIEGIYRE